MRVGYQLMKIWIILALLALCACTPAPRSLLAEQALCVAIGSDREPMDLCVLNIRSGLSYRVNEYFMVTDGNIREVDGLEGGFQTYELLVSPARRSLAIVEDGGEGHRFFAVVNLEQLRLGHKPERVAPHDICSDNFFNLHWQGELLAYACTFEDPETGRPTTLSSLFDPVSGRAVQLPGREDSGQLEEFSFHLRAMFHQGYAICGSVPGRAGRAGRWLP